MNIQDMPGHVIRRLQQVSTHVFSAHLTAKGHNLTSVQFAALDAIAARPGVDQAQVAALIAYDRATIGGVIDRLEKKGLVTRQISEKDRRSREVTLTENGQDMLEALLPVVRAVQDDILLGLTHDERAQFLTLGKKVVAAHEADVSKK